MEELFQSDTTDCSVSVLREPPDEGDAEFYASRLGLTLAEWEQVPEVARRSVVKTFRQFFEIVRRHAIPLPVVLENGADSLPNMEPSEAGTSP
jgi:hypothetical protein